MLDIPSISVVVAAASVIIAVIIAILELRNLIKARQTDLVVNLYTAFNAREFTEADIEVLFAEYEDYDDFLRKYGPFASQKPIHVSVRMVASLFEAIGVLLNRKLIDPGLVSDLFSVRIRWEKIKPIAEGLRKEFDEPRIYEWFEYLNNEMRKRDQRLQQKPQ